MFGKEQNKKTPAFSWCLFSDELARRRISVDQVTFDELMKEIHLA